ncbi:MAG: DUF4856 domain-containing protein [Ignavibacteriae bacterium]|nr:DUF4856 domain-containing protein [Ignavibacteriota bacterium]MCB9216956.1 DUF4856 domain-containing protein [Ignavibacteria bacterium]
MTFYRLLFLPILAMASLLSSCGEDTGTNPNPDSIPVPQAYAFASRFQSGSSSVNYGGQTVRNLLIQDLSQKISQLGTSGASPITAAELLSLYEYNDASNLSSTTSTGSLPAVERMYSIISTGKNLSGKISKAQLVGRTDNADDLLRSWFATIEQLSSDQQRIGTPMAYTTDDGLNLYELVNKLLLGSVAYYQGTGIYLNGITERNNAAPDGESAPYTEMEHAWDEAFGYFGAARNYSAYTDVQLAGSTEDFVGDVSGDGKIDFQSEYNFAFARNAGKRDAGSATGRNFTKSIFDAFLGGRTSIVNKGTTADLIIFRNQAVEEWEKLLAATVIHYINETLENMEELTSESTPENSLELNEHWAEMKGYSMALQYNPMRKILDAEISVLQVLIGSHPVYAVPGSNGFNTYQAELKNARSLLQEKYGFAEADVLSW